MSNALSSIRNFYAGGSNVPRQLPSSSPQAARNLSNIISPVQLQRLKTDIGMWRECINEAENAWYPQRIKMQRMFIDTILNGHVYSVMERRKDFTLLRDFKICNAKEVESKDLYDYFSEQTWLPLFIAYCLDALFFGYSLISLGDITADSFDDLSIIRRWNVSPDRMNVTSLVYSLDGVKFHEKPYSDWHIWVPTASETGANTCGYGLFYKIALYEIFLRNTIGFNADFVELFAMPYRVGKTTKTTEIERQELYDAIRDMGSAGFAIIDPTDEIAFLETKLSGTGWQSYGNLEERCQKMVSKIVLGHADAMDSIPGKLGTGGDKDDNPITKAGIDKQTKDGKFIETIINKQLLPKMRNLGFKIPMDYKLLFKNDEEKEAFRKREDDSNKTTAEIFKTIKDAGGDPDWKYFSDRTGIKVEKAAEPQPAPIMQPALQTSEDNLHNAKVKNKLQKLYGE